LRAIVLCHERSIAQVDGKSMLKRFLADESGATAIEYGLLAAIMAVALITGFGAFSNALSNQMIFLANTMNDAWN
jgi:pilus assembly protein Flp/PilA